MMEEALKHAGENYNVTVPIHNALGALGKQEALKNFLHREIEIFETSLRKNPEDARARVLLATNYAALGRYEDAKREADLAMTLRPDDSMILYNTACVFCSMNNKKDALIAIKKPGNPVTATRTGRDRILIFRSSSETPSSTNSTPRLPEDRVSDPPGGLIHAPPRHRRETTSGEASELRSQASDSRLRVSGSANQDLAPGRPAPGLP